MRNKTNKSQILLFFGGSDVGEDQKVRCWIILCLLFLSVKPCIDMGVKTCCSMYLFHNLLSQGLKQSSTQAHSVYRYQVCNACFPVLFDASSPVPLCLCLLSSCITNKPPLILASQRQKPPQLVIKHSFIPPPPSNIQFHSRCSYGIIILQPLLFLSLSFPFHPNFTPQTPLPALTPNQSPYSPPAKCGTHPRLPTSYSHCQAATGLLTLSVLAAA